MLSVSTCSELSQNSFITSKSDDFVGLRKNHKPLRYENQTRAFPSYKKNHVPEDQYIPSKFHQPTRGKSDKFPVNRIGKGDEDTSLSSIEYSGEQARYVRNWLDSLNKFETSVSDPILGKEGGNVIGIRNSRSRYKYREDRKGKNLWKSSLESLQSEHDKMKLQFEQLKKNFRTLLQEKDSKIHELQNLIGGNGIQMSRDCSTCKCDCHLGVNKKFPNHVHQINNLRLEVDQLKQRLKLKESNHPGGLTDLRRENDDLKRKSAEVKREFQKELELLRNQVKALSLIPDNKLLFKLQDENSQLKRVEQIKEAEVHGLRENYMHMESQLRMLIEDRNCIDNEKNEELSKIMVELCRLQVYQPKLEMILETERNIKSELQKKVGNLEEKNLNLTEQLEVLQSQLDKERSSSRRNDPIQIEAIQEDLARLRDKYDRLLNDKADCEVLIRTFKSKLVCQDKNHQSIIDSLRKVNREENDRLHGKILKLESEAAELQSRLERLQNELNLSLSERKKLTSDLENLLKLHELESIRRSSLWLKTSRT